MPVVPDTYRRTPKYGLVYSALVMAAHARSMLAYTGVARLAGLAERGNPMATQVGRLVGEISEDEVTLGRPMLSALVVEKDTGQPGEGFFKLARDLGVFNGNGKNEKRKFLSREKAKLYSVWA